MPPIALDLNGAAPLVLATVLRPRKHAPTLTMAPGLDAGASVDLKNAPHRRKRPPNAPPVLAIHPIAAVLNGAVPLDLENNPPPSKTPRSPPISTPPPPTPSKSIPRPRKHPDHRRFPRRRAPRPRNQPPALDFTPIAPDCNTAASVDLKNHPRPQKHTLAPTITPDALVVTAVVPPALENTPDRPRSRCRRAQRPQNQPPHLENTLIAPDCNAATSVNLKTNPPALGTAPAPSPTLLHPHKHPPA